MEEWPAKVCTLHTFGIALFIGYRPMLDQLAKIPAPIRAIARNLAPSISASFSRRIRAHNALREEAARRLEAEARRVAAEKAAVVAEQERIAQRRKFAMSYYEKPLRLIDEWAPRLTETSNFYYKLQPQNRLYLAMLLSGVTGESQQKVTAYLDELENDEELRTHLELSLKDSSYARDIAVDYGRRLGWYAMVRILKPKVTIETGVDHGVGSCVLASAVLRNRAEGFDSVYYGTELRTEGGQLFNGKYAQAGKILYGDSIASLASFEQPIDLFINDSDHSAEYEYQEYLTIKSKLTHKGVILGDNAHVTDALARFSMESDRRFFFFNEKPDNHWYPGAGIGISLPAK